ncbi:hypothetical protein [Cupriavidus sp. YAF13]|uniref:hypothetical protein n=1 Tax=Cupriavidus sp. YAF13 TaxID=3233075 RepID=UPI003F930DC0
MTATRLTHNECHGIAAPQVVRLMAWIDLHDRPALTTFNTADGTLTVTSIECHNGVAHEVKETIPATVAAARDLLGY